MLDDKTLYWLGRRKRDIKNKRGYFCRHCGQYKKPFIEWCNDEYYCPTCTKKYDYIDAAEFEARVSATLAYSEDCYITDDCVFFGEGTCAWCKLKDARLAVEAEMIAEGKGPGRKES